MKFAHVDKRRVSATPNTQAECPCCGGRVISKCGARNVWHWAHKSRRHCDSWYERETFWHRNWKGHFPDANQEVVHTAKNGERHVADVKTDKGLTIEFQHSYISMDEIQSREEFYTNLIWVVDGLRLKHDFPTFSEHVTTYKPVTVNPPSYQFNYMVPQITRRWLNSQCVVYFDFGGDDLWQFTPFRGVWQGYTVQVQKTDFLKACIEGSRLHGYPVWAGLEEPDWMMKRPSKLNNYY